VAVCAPVCDGDVMIGQLRDVPRIDHRRPNVAMSAITSRPAANARDVHYVPLTDNIEEALAPRQ